jgi:hypothetical protein
MPPTALLVEVEVNAESCWIASRPLRRTGEETGGRIGRPTACVYAFDRHIGDEDIRGATSSSAGHCFGSS